MERVRERFKQIVIECVNDSIFLKHMIYLPLYEFMKIVPIEYLPEILSNYYVDVFRPADRELGQLLLNYEPNTALNHVSNKIIERCIRDTIKGEYSKFGKKSNKNQIKIKKRRNKN